VRVQSVRISGIIERLRTCCVRQAHQAQRGVDVSLGEKLRTVFSKQATDGASSVADEQLMIAERAAAKKIACATSGVCSRSSVGNTRCESISIRPLNCSGWISVAEQAMNIGAKVIES
jgi:hypothetical protein